MWPVVTHVHVAGVERPIASYGVMFALALLIGASSFVVLCKRTSLDVGRAIASAALSVGAGFIGAQLLFAIVELARTGELVWPQGRFGFVFMGGALGGALGLCIAARLWSLPFATLADHATLGLAIGHALGRIGCVLGGCCYGAHWSGIDGRGLLSITYTHPLAPASLQAQPRLPLPIVEALAVLLLVASLVLVRGQHRGLSRARAWLQAPGRLALAYALGYSTLRLGLERLRGDDVRGVMFDGMLSTSQLIGLSIVSITLGVYVVRARRRARAAALARGTETRLGHALLVTLAVTAGWLVLRSEDARAQLTMQAAAVLTIDAGWFVLGSDDADVEAAIALCRQDVQRADVCRSELFADELAAHRVYLSAYRIDRTEVSNASYRRCVAANVCAPQRASDADPRLAEPEHPVSSVTYREAMAYCAWRGGSLPTEAQWEKAARGSNGRRFPWGNLWNSRIANHGRGLEGAEDPIDGYNFAAPVDAFGDARSPYGLLNMAGNVAELTADYYDERGYMSPERIDPRGPKSGAERVVRGGGWRSPAFALRATHRGHMSENETRPDTGFRCAYAP